MAGERSVYNGAFNIGVLSIPVSIYKMQDTTAIPASEYHLDCDGRIRQSKFCENHPDEQVVTYSAITVEDKLIAITSDDRDYILDRKAPFEFVGAFKLRDLDFYDSYFPADTYRVGIPSSQKQGTNDALFTLFETMRKKKLFLLTTIGGVSGLKRYAILLPNRLLITLSYSEEVRNNPYLDGVIDDKIQSFLVNTGFGELQTHFPRLTNQIFMERFNDWIRVKLARKTSRRSTTSPNPKKRSPEKVTAV